MLVVAGGMFAIFYFATLYVQQVLGLSPVQAGLGFLPLTAAIIAASGAAQALIPKIGVRAIALAGMLIAAVGLVLLSRVSATGTYVSDVMPGIVVMGFGLGFVFVPMTLIGTTNVAAEDAGLASGLFNTSQQIGGALGLAILSTIDANATSGSLSDLGHAASPAELASALVSGYSAGFLAAVGLMLLGFVAALTLIRSADVAAINQTSSESAPAA